MEEIYISFHISNKIRGYTKSMRDFFYGGCVWAQLRFGKVIDTNFRLLISCRAGCVCKNKVFNQIFITEYFLLPHRNSSVCLGMSCLFRAYDS